MKPEKKDGKDSLLSQIDELDAQWDDSAFPLYHALCRVVFFKHFRYTLKSLSSDIFEDLAQEGVAKIHSMLKRGYYDKKYKLSNFLYTGVRYAMRNFLYDHYGSHTISYDELLDNAISEIHGDHDTQDDTELLPLKEVVTKSLQYEMNELPLFLRCKILSHFYTPKKMLNLAQINPEIIKYVSLLVSDRPGFKLANVLEQNGQGELLISMLFLLPGEKIQLPSPAAIKTIQMQARMYCAYKKGMSIPELVHKFASRTVEVTRIIARMTDLEKRAALGEVGESTRQERTEMGLESHPEGRHPDLPPTSKKWKDGPADRLPDEGWTEVDYPFPKALTEEPADIPADAPKGHQPSSAPVAHGDEAWTEVDYPDIPFDLPPAQMVGAASLKLAPVVAKVTPYKKTPHGVTAILDCNPFPDRTTVPRTHLFPQPISTFRILPQRDRHGRA
jgi:hypothetical protein